jgi:hypothetical protein
MSQDVKHLLNEIGNMQYFTVIRQIVGSLPQGPVPFDMKVTEDGTAFIHVLASDMDDASGKVNAWLKSL